jgi:uncharacterized membrane protein
MAQIITVFVLVALVVIGGVAFCDAIIRDARRALRFRRVRRRIEHLGR